jgi:hypothetical protein
MGAIKELDKKLDERSKQEGISMNQYCVYLLSGGSNNTDFNNLHA